MKLHRSRCRRHMSLVAWGILAGLLMIAVGPVAVNAAEPIYVPNQYIVKATPGATYSVVCQAVSQLGGTVTKVLPLPDTYVATIGKTSASASKTVAKRSTKTTLTQWPILALTPNYIYHVLGGSAIPKDPFFSKQWNMGLIHMPRAWTVEQGSASVTVAVLDSGVANHPDLLGRLVQGYDFVDNDADPSNDLNGHGTFCAGIIGAQGDNDIGVCGVCWNGVNIMPIRVMDANGRGAFDVITQGMMYALNPTTGRRPDVLSMSIGGPGAYGGNDANQHLALQMLNDAGVILVAAAGNIDATDPNTIPVMYPAAFPECIAVASTGPYDEIAPYSCYGPAKEVDIAAPGGDSVYGEPGYIFSTQVTWPNGFPGMPLFGYGNTVTIPGQGTFPEQGTSYACPAVAGAAALLLSHGVSPAQVRTRLTTSARKPSSGKMDVMKYGAGILDVAGALNDGSISIAKPLKGSTVTSSPDFKINCRGLTPDSLSVYLDYADSDENGIPDDLASETPILTGQNAVPFLTGGNTAYAFNYSQLSDSLGNPLKPLAPGIHFIYITGTIAVSGEVLDDWGTFNAASNIITRGTYLASLPYSSSFSLVDGLRHPLPQELYYDASTSQPLEFRPDAPNRARLMRWDALDGQYLPYEPQSSGLPLGNDLSWVNPISPYFNVPTAGGYLGSDRTTLQFPAGAGFWLILQQDAVLSNQFPTIDSTTSFRVPLFKGWNLIGNPFARQVALTTLKLEYQGKTRTLQQDQDPNYTRNPWLQLPARPKSQFFGYSSVGIPGYAPVPWSGTLDPYQGYWVRALVGGNADKDRLTLVVQ